MPKLKEIYDAFKDKGLVIIGVHTPDSAEEMPKFVKEQKMEWPIVVDDDNKTAKAYDIEGWPTMYLIDREGKIVLIDHHISKDEVAKLFKDDDKKSDEKKSDEKKSDEKK